MENRRRRPRSESYTHPAGCPPGWAWLIAGILIGMFASFLFYLREVVPLLPQQVNTSATTTVVTRPAVKAVEPPVKPLEEVPSATLIPATVPEKAVETKPIENKTTTPPTTTDSAASHFEFYDSLPDQKGKVPSSSQAADDLPVTTPGKYVLQVGSFRDKQQADGLKAHLANLGVSAQIGQTTNEAGEEWYRVQVGPFTDLEQLNHSRAVLSDNGIHGILLKF